MLKATTDRKSFDFTGSASNLICLPGTRVPKTVVIDTNLADVKMTLTPPEQNKKRSVESLTIAGTEVKHSKRFGDSFIGIIGQSNSVFNLYEPSEVVERYIKCNTNARIKVTAVVDKNDQLNALAAVNPNANIFDPSEFVQILRDNGVNMMEVGYDNGSVTTVHTPILPKNFLVAGDDMTSKFMLHTPLDGYGSVTSYLAIIRAICANLGILMDEAFASGTKIGKGKGKDKKPKISRLDQLSRFLATFNNEEGYDAVVERFTKSRVTSASLEDYYKIAGTIRTVVKDGGTAANVGPASWNSMGLRDGVPVSYEEIRSRLGILAGGGERHINEQYGFVSIDQIHQKRRQTTYTDTTVYELINFATEVSTHLLNEGGRRVLNSVIGKIVVSSGGYDLENLDERKYDHQPQGIYFPELGGEVSGLN